MTDPDPDLFRDAARDLTDALIRLATWCNAHPRGARQDRIDRPLGRFIAEVNAVLARVHGAVRTDLGGRHNARRRAKRTGGGGR